MCNQWKGKFFSMCPLPWMSSCNLLGLRTYRVLISILTLPCQHWIRCGRIPILPWWTVANFADVFFNWKWIYIFIDHMYFHIVPCHFTCTHTLDTWKTWFKFTRLQYFWCTKSLSLLIVLNSFTNCYTERNLIPNTEESIFEQNFCKTGKLFVLKLTLPSSAFEFSYCWQKFWTLIYVFTWRTETICKIRLQWIDYLDGDVLNIE